MIIVSSNFATNLIMQKVGAENVTRSMRQLGAENIQVLRGVEDNKAFEKRNKQYHYRSRPVSNI